VSHFETPADVHRGDSDHHDPEYRDLGDTVLGMRTPRSSTFRWVALAALAIACRTPHDPAIPHALEIPLTSYTYHLANGMRVVFVPDSSADMMTVFARYDAGAIDDPPGQEGVAHLAAHLTYTQLATPTATLWDALDRSATWISATPTSNRTEFSEQCLPEQLPLVLKLESMRLARGCESVSPEWFEKIRGEVADELRGNDSLVTSRTLAHVLYPAADPFRRVYDADAASVAKLTRDQACAFMTARYTPANIVFAISGPVAPEKIERILQADLARVPARPVAARVARAALPTGGLHTRTYADVTAPTLVVAWPLPEDRAARAMAAVAAKALADQLGAEAYGDDHFAILWFAKNPNGIEKRIAQLQSTLEGPRIRSQGFAWIRTKVLTEQLAAMDFAVWRLANLADGDKLDSSLAAVAHLTRSQAEDLLESTLSWSRARLVELDPDGTRPIWRPASLPDPAHTLPATSNAADTNDAPFAMPEIGAIARARSFTLANGLRVVLAPTSPVPLAHIRLSFPVGNAADPPDRPGTASAAIAALGEVARRGEREVNWSWAVASQRWRAGLDSSSFEVRGPFMYVDLLFERYGGLARAHLEERDIRRGFDWMVRTAKSPEHVIWDEQAELRASLYGADHPYGRASKPDAHDVERFDSHEVESFYARYLQPDHATLIVTGGFDPDVVSRLVHRTFDGWAGKSETIAVAAPHGTGGMYASDERGDTISLRVQWAGGLEDEHRDAREILGEMIKRVSPELDSDYEPLHQGGTYTLHGKLDPGRAPEAVREISTRLATIGSGSAEDRAAFVAARRHGARWRLGASWNALSWSNNIWFALEAGHDLAWLRGMPARKAKVTYDEVAELAKAELSPGRATWHISGPHAAVVAVYQALGVEPKWFIPATGPALDQ
jgi:zinc protease